MSEHESGPVPIRGSMAPVIGIGGLLSEEIQWLYYQPLLSGPDSGLSAKERYLPIPDKGLSPIAEMYGKLEEQLDAVYERLGEPVVVFGHSFGGLMATILALNNPNKVSAVDCHAGIQDGVEEFTFSGKVLHRVLGSRDHAEDLLRDSDFMTDHRQRMATEWSPHIPLYLTAPTYDLLIPAPQGLELELPDGQQPVRRIVVPHLRGLHFGIREKTQHLENVEELRSILPAGHVDIAICPPVISSLRQLRRDVAAERPETRAVQLPTNILGGVPVAA